MRSPHRPWRKPTIDIRALDADGGGDFTTDLGPYTLHSVLATPLCYSHRGVGTDGICN